MGQVPPSIKKLLDEYDFTDELVYALYTPAEFKDLMATKLGFYECLKTAYETVKSDIDSARRYCKHPGFQKNTADICPICGYDEEVFPF